MGLDIIHIICEKLFGPFWGRLGKASDKVSDISRFVRHNNGGEKAARSKKRDIEV